MKMVKLGKIVENLDNKRIPLNDAERKAKTVKKLYPYVGANNIVDYIDEYIFDEQILCVAEDGGSWGLCEKCANIYLHERAFIQDFEYKTFGIYTGFRFVNRSIFYWPCKRFN